ncbi:hypothetical protein H0W26_02485 [Candidatus Dependentiae bacterium]|nr:hypothetical protein [Candidatus Dependentiae bacterium]
MIVIQNRSFRLKLLIVLVVVAFGGITAYLFQLQIVNADLFYKQSQKNFLRTREIAPPRGSIIDCKGVVLASNVPVYSLSWQGSGNKTVTSEQEKLIALLQSVFALTPKQIDLIKLHEKRATRVKLFFDISFDQIASIIEQISHEKNIALEQTYKRSYPHAALASHIIGYIGLNNNAPGKMGLELLYNKELRGKSGKIITIINAVGRNLQAYAVKGSLAGTTLQTTLDSEVQQLAERTFPPGYEGSCILMDESGALEVVLSRPSFDPLLFLKPLEASQWKLLQEKHRFMNRAFSGCYPPASLFKLVTLVAALETGIIQQKINWHCIGHTTFRGRRYHCNNRAGHGILSTEEALAHSCNIPFFEIGKKINIDTLALYARELGLGTKMGILFPESSGLIPTSAWKKRVKKEQWFPGETLSAAIGQTAMLVTPLQIAGMFSAFCSGYRCIPRILIDEPIVTQKLSLKPETLTFIQQCLSSVIKEGTGSHLKSLKNFTLKGKSGTAQVRALGKKVLCKEHLCHGYLAVHFRYKDNRPRTLVVLIEHAGSSSVAVKVAHTFLKRYAALIDARNP